MRFSCRAAWSTPASTATLRTVPARAHKQYEPGAGDTGIGIGNTVPYSGPASASASASASAVDVFAPCARHAAAHTRAGAGRRPRGAGAGAA